jgi:hypothetical protein
VQQDRKPSPLQRGGTLQGEAAAGKDASEAFKKAVTGAAASGPTLQVRGSLDTYWRMQHQQGEQTGGMEADWWHLATCVTCSPRGSAPILQHSRPPSLSTPSLRSAILPFLSHPTPFPPLQMIDGRFVDSRWVAGTWDLSRFANAAGETDWDAVIDAEMARRKLLEDSPIACSEWGLDLSGCRSPLLARRPPASPVACIITHPLPPPLARLLLPSPCLPARSQRGPGAV